MPHTKIESLQCLLVPGCQPFAGVLTASCLADCGNSLAGAAAGAVAATAAAAAAVGGRLLARWLLLLLLLQS